LLKTRTSDVGARIEVSDNEVCEVAKSRKGNSQLSMLFGIYEFFTSKREKNRRKTQV